MTLFGFCFKVVAALFVRGPGRDLHRPPELDVYLHLEGFEFETA